MANQRLTKKKLKNHLAYSWWKYALAAAVSTMLVSIVFAVTEYRPPDDKKVEFYVLNSYADTETMQADFWPLLQARKPEQEKLTVININLTDSSNIYAPMQFSTYVAAQQGRFVFDFAGRDAQNHFGRRAGIAGGADALSGKRRD